MVVSLTFLFLLRSWRAWPPDCCVEVSMATAPPKTRPTTSFHATMIVTRVEEWCVEAQTLEEARALLEAGEGHRCHLGDCLHRELEAMDGAEPAA